MNSYRSQDRPGIRTSSTVDPKRMLEDIDERLHKLEATATPLIGLNNYMGRGKKPISPKIQVEQQYGFDNYDYVSATSFGTGNWTRYARLTIDQISRPDVNYQMYYHPQDTFYIEATGENVEVVMTPRAAIKLEDGTEFAFDNNSLTGNTTTRSADGTIIVRNIDPLALKTFTTSDVIYLGRTIYESQKIQADPKQSDTVFDCNFVEHVEEVFNMTEDQKVWIQTRGTVPEWTRGQEDTMKRIKTNVEYKFMFGRRGSDTVNTGRLKYYMNGIINVLKTNVAYYNPTTVTDYETLFGNFLFEQAFRWNPYGFTKVGLCGGRFLFNFNQAFREYRRTSTLEGIGSKIGLNFQTYEIPGGMSVSLLRSEILRQNTTLENWCFVIEPKCMELRVVKDFNSRFYQNNDERDYKIMMEWQGTIAWHLEQSHALLRTV